MNQRPILKERSRARVKLCGADIELGNFVRGVDLIGGSGHEASGVLLDQIAGLPIAGYLNYGIAAGLSHGYNAYQSSYSGKGEYAAGSASNPQEIGRKFLVETGGCAYIDLNHLELCIPEVIDAFDHVAAWHGMLRVAHGALQRANEGQPPDQRIEMLVNNSDGLGNSYGSHMNILIKRRTFDDLFRRKLHYLQLLASFQVSSVILTGQGKVGAENNRGPVPYQISQRADFFETLQGVQTTFDRPIVNSRDEPLCGKNWKWIDDPDGPARLHIIFFDSTLAHGSSLFRVGLMQLVLTLLEYGFANHNFILDDPLDAILRYSHDPSLKARAALTSGRKVTALELQSAFLDEVKHHAAKGLFEGVVPRANDIIALWEDTLTKFAARDFAALAPRLDWVMKQMAIERAFEQRPNLDWNSPEAKVLDHIYSSLDHGLYWAYEAAGATEQLVSRGRIEFFAGNPPEDTRAWTRAMLLRRAGAAGVVSVDWDSITFRFRRGSFGVAYRTLQMADPLAFTRAQTEAFFEQHEDLEDLLNALEELAGSLSGATGAKNKKESTSCSSAFDKTKEATHKATAAAPRAPMIC